MLRPDRHYLEAALAHDPDDRAGHAAYADLLAEAGDPRGEYIQIRLTLEDGTLPAPTRRQLEQQAHDLRRQHERDWLGELAPFLLDPVGVADDLVAEPEGFGTLSRGWLDRLLVRNLSMALSQALSHAPAARLLRQLRIVRTTHASQREPTATGAARLEPLRTSSVLGNLELFHLGDSERELGPGYHADGTGLVDVLDRMPRLRELHVLAQPLDSRLLFALPWPELRVLRVDFGGPLALDALASNPTLGQLTHLLLDERRHEVGINLDQPTLFDPVGLRALANSPHLGRLRHLRLRLPDLGNAGCAILIASGLIDRLESLDLRRSALTGQAAELLAACPAVARLGRLDVAGNAISEEGVERLLGLGIAVQAGEQFVGLPPTPVAEDEPLV